MLQKSKSCHADAIFAELERDACDPVWLYRHLLRCAAEQLDARAVEVALLREKIRMLQSRWRGQRTEQRLAELRWQVRCRDQRGQPVMSATKAVASTPTNRYPQELSRENQFAEGQGLYGQDTHRTRCWVSKARSGNNSGGGTSRTMPSPSSLPLPQPPPPPPAPPTRATGCCSARDDNAAVIERVLGAMLLLVLDDDPLDGLTSEMRSYGLTGNAIGLCEAVMLSIRNVRQREAALKRRVKELEEQCANSRTQPQHHHQHQHQQRGVQHSQTCSTPPLLRFGGDDSDVGGSGSVIPGYTTCSSSFSYRGVHHGAAESRGDDDPVAIKPESSCDIEGGIKNSSITQSENLMTDNLVGTTEVMEYARWKHLFMEDFLPS